MNRLTTSLRRCEQPHPTPSHCPPQRVTVGAGLRFLLRAKLQLVCQNLTAACDDVARALEVAPSMLEAQEFQGHMRDSSNVTPAHTHRRTPHANTHIPPNNN